MRTQDTVHEREAQGRLASAGRGLVVVGVLLAAMVSLGLAQVEQPAGERAPRLTYACLEDEFGHGQSELDLTTSGSAARPAVAAFFFRTPVAVPIFQRTPVAVPPPFQRTPVPAT